MAGRGTPATQLLAKHKIAHTVHEYAHDPRNPNYGTEAAEALRIPADQVFKTLLAEVDGQLAVGIVPVSSQLDLKALAQAVGGKRARMADITLAERTTGCVAGGISPLGQRKRLPTVLDTTATTFGTMYCSAGRRGLEIELAAADLVALLDATIADIRA